jgi:hypothetical protein
MMNSRFLFSFLSMALLLFGCASVEREDAALKDALKPIREQFAPDRRVAVFDVDWVRHGSSFVVKGQMEDPDARRETINAIESTLGRSVVDSIRMLPDPALGDRQFGIVTVSVGNMRSKPSQPAELATQVLMGMVVRLLKEEDGWYYVQSHDRYLGWLEGRAMMLTDRTGVDEWADAKKMIVTSYHGIVREKPSETSLPVSDLVVGGMLKKTVARGGWIGVELPDGAKGFVESSIVQDYDAWRASRRLTAENIERAARMFMGVPYLWGGTSAKGMDCSGFTKTVFRLNGMELNRDANQQATMGEDVVVGDEFQGLQKGDLVFFGRKVSSERPERITHVGIYLTNKEFIHAPGGGRVRINSFDPAASNFSESLLKSFVRARRIIPSSNVREIG